MPSWRFAKSPTISRSACRGRSPSIGPVLIYRPIRVAIVHGPQRAEDARYVAAAVRAVGEISDRQIMVEIREENASTVLPESDWVFRLGASPLTPSMSHVLAEGRVNVV